MKCVSHYAWKDLIYIYDNLDSPFLINSLNIRTQIRKSPCASVESSERTRDVTGMSTLRFAHKKNILAPKHPCCCCCWNPKLLHLSQNQKLSGAADSWWTPTVVHSQTHTARPKKIGLSHKQAFEMLMIMILFFTGEDRQREPERQTHTESQIS